MRILIFAALMLAACSAFADKVRGDGKNEIRLMNGPCVHGGVLGMLKPEWRKKFKKAQAVFSGKMFYACWIDIPEERMFSVWYEDGDVKHYPIKDFTEEYGA